jgi:hypothetical protein
MVGAMRSTVRRLATAAVASLTVGGVLLGAAVVASAGSATLSFTPNSDVGTSLYPVTVTGSGFSPKTAGGLQECSTASPQPTVTVSLITGSTPIPVSCGPIIPLKTSSKGKFSTHFTIQPGVLGPPNTGPDSSGGDATADAQNFPCPPTAAQVAAGASCEIEYFDTAGETAGQAIAFNFESTTTTTSPPATTQPCNAASNSASGKNSKTGATATVTVDPATCLVGGIKTTVTGTGLVASSTGSILECNNDPSQPVSSYAGGAAFIPISCSPVATFTTSSTGTVPAADQSFTVLESAPGFTIGGGNGTPEQNSATSTACTGTCTGNPVADAANYPCPPTAAQTAAGDSCVIAIGDLGGDQVAVPISFNTLVAPPSGQSGGGSSKKAATSSKTTAKTAKASSTSASGGSLAFTGPGVALRVVGLVGLVLVLLGAGLLVFIDAPRRLLMLGVRRRRPPDGT